MKYFLFSFLIISFSLSAQDLNIETQIRSLKANIYSANGGEKLKWLERYCELTYNKKELSYDSVVSVTIDYALQLDSLNIAFKQIANLLFFKNNIQYKHYEAVQIFENFIHKTNGLYDNTYLGEFYLNGADSYYFTGDRKKALKFYDISKNIASKSGNKKLSGTVNLYLGFAYTELLNLQDAFNHLQIAKKYFTELKDTTNIIAAYYGLSSLYSRNGFYGESKNVRDEAIRLAISKRDNIHLAILHYNAAQDLRRNGKLEDCIHELLLAVEFEKKAGNNDYIYSKIICEIVIAYIENNELSKAEDYLKEINSNIERIKNDENGENYLEVLKNVAFARRKYREALKLGKEHLELEVNKSKIHKVIEAEKFLSKLYFAIGDKSNANFHEIKYYQLKDSLFSEQKLKYFTFYNTLFNSQEKDFQIQSQKKDLDLLIEKNKKNSIRFFLGAVLLISFFVFIILIRSNKEAKKNEKLIQSFSQNLISAQDKERHELARDLHDSIGQHLIVLYKKIKLFNNDDLALLCKSTIEEVRAISRGLYPPQIIGTSYTEAINSLINEIDKNTNIFFTCDIDCIDHLLTRNQEIHTYRIIQEILSNIVKHSNAKAVFVSIEKTKTLITIRIEDNGIGFTLSNEQMHSKNLGMKTIFERSKIINSKLEIKTELNKGTIIQLIIPIK